MLTIALNDPFYIINTIYPNIIGDIYIVFVYSLFISFLSLYFTLMNNVNILILDLKSFRVINEKNFKR